MRRVLLLGGVVLCCGASVSAEPGAGEPTVCERIAAAAYQANSNLDTSTVADSRSAPFVREWLVASALVGREDGKGYKQVGKGGECYADVSRSEPVPCPKGMGKDHIFLESSNTASVYETNPDLFEDYARWDTLVGMLPLEGRLVAVKAVADYSPYRRGWSTGVFLKSLIDEQSMVCAFENKVHEVHDPQPYSTPNACDAIVQDEANIVPVGDNVPEGAREALLAQGEFDRPNDHYVDGYVDIDIDGDEIPDRLVSITFSPSTGICGHQYFDIVETGTYDTFAEGELRQRVAEAQAAQYARPDGSPGLNCYRRTNLRRADGQVYFERVGASLNDVPDSDNSYVVKWGGPLQRTLRVIEGGEVEMRCATRFSVEPVIIHDREKQLAEAGADAP